MKVEWSKMNTAGKIYTLSRLLYLKKVPLIPRLLKLVNRAIFSCDLPYKTDMHPTVILGHNGLATVVHPNSIIGKKTQIMQRVTIGGNRDKIRVVNGEEIGWPIIGKNVFIGPGASILGPVIIGDNAQIGAGAVVLDDVPKNGVAVGMPAKVLKILEDSEIIENKP